MVSLLSLAAGLASWRQVTHATRTKTSASSRLLGPRARFVATSPEGSPRLKRLDVPLRHRPLSTPPWSVVRGTCSGAASGQLTVRHRGGAPVASKTYWEHADSIALPRSHGVEGANLLPPVAGDHPGRPCRWAWNFISRGRRATTSWAPIRPAVACVPLRCVPPTKFGYRITGTPRSVVADLDPDPWLFEPQRAGVAAGRCPGT